MKRFGTGEYNGIRHLAPHVMMQLDNGFVMPNGVLHSPTNLCTHELHVTMDEHFLDEDLTLDGRIGAADTLLPKRSPPLSSAYGSGSRFGVNRVGLCSSTNFNILGAFATKAAQSGSSRLCQPSGEMVRI